MYLSSQWASIFFQYEMTESKNFRKEGALRIEKTKREFIDEISLQKSNKLNIKTFAGY